MMNLKPTTMKVHKLADVKTDTIGEGTIVWQFSVICKGAIIGSNCNINCHTFIESDVIIADNVTVKSGVYLWNGLRVESDVFIGPNATFVNDAFPRTKQYLEVCQNVWLLKGCSIGANATILGNVTIGKYAFVAAGSVVTKNVPNYALVKGSPARIVGYVSKRGMKLVEKDGVWYSKDGLEKFIFENDQLKSLDE